MALLVPFSQRPMHTDLILAQGRGIFDWVHR